MHFIFRMETNDELGNGMLWTLMTTKQESIGGDDWVNGTLIANWIDDVIGFPVYVIGMSVNLLILAVLLSSSHYRSSSFGLLLICLSVSDMGVLSTALLRHCIR